MREVAHVHRGFYKGPSLTNTVSEVTKISLKVLYNGQNLISPQNINILSGTWAMRVKPIIS